MLYCVVPSCRPDRLAEFKQAWSNLFARHDIKLIVVIDGEVPQIQVGDLAPRPAHETVPDGCRDLFFNFTDSVRNYGFAFAARCKDMTAVLTLDDDVLPPPGADPIADHLAVIGRRVSLSWMNTCPAPPDPYLRGVPYTVRNEGEVVLSHGVWCNVPDFDAPTQLQLSAAPDGIPADLPYHNGPVPKGVLFPFCGMNVLIARKALPCVYYAPMGLKAYNLNRFGDIWCGVAFKPHFDRKGWAVWTGASKVVHSRASDVYRNLAAEAEGLRLNETAARDIHMPYTVRDGVLAHPYFTMYQDRRLRYADYVAGLLEGKH